MRKYLPNILSNLRIVLTFPILWLLFSSHRWWSLALFIIAMLTDVLDGWLARKFQWKTHAGYFLDPVADKFVVMFTVAGFIIQKGMPLWGILIFSRDVGVIVRIIFNMAKYGAKGASMLEPSLLGKTVTVLQTLTIAVTFINFEPKIFLILTAIVSALAGIRYLFSTPSLTN